jgi:hypothetical protein
VLRKLAYPPERGKWFHIRHHDIEESLRGILDVIMKTVVSSGQSSSTGSPTLIHAPAPTIPGVTQGAAEDWI